MVVILFLLGLVIGSFLGVLTFRLPRKISFIKGRSICPNCKHVIRAYDNIPLFSFIALQGSCRDCHIKIPYREPLIELATGLTFVVIGPNILNLIISCILISIFVIDAENQFIPDNLVFFGFTILILKFLLFNSPLFENLLAGAVAGCCLLFLHIITKGKGMGLGDVKLSLLIGSIIGMHFLFVWLLFSFIGGAIFGIFLMLFKNANLKKHIAFGPFLIIGLLLTIYFGSAIII